jgi:hypothetical protein
MKHRALYLMAALALSAAPFAAAEEGSPQETLKTEYKVDDARIQGLRDQKLGYGEISIALALAEKRPGGITDANVAAVMAERNGPPKMGWGQVAKKEGTTLGKVNARNKRVDAEIRKHEKAEAREKHEKGEKHERAEKAERAEKPENPKH